MLVESLLVGCDCCATAGTTNAEASSNAANWPGNKLGIAVGLVIDSYGLFLLGQPQNPAGELLMLLAL